MFAFGPDSYSGLSEVQGPARFYALTGDLVGVRSGETLSFDTSKRTWYEAAGPVWMIAGRDIVASGTHLGQPTAVQPEEMGVGQEGITSTGNLFVHNDVRDVSRVSAGRDILYSSFDIAGPGTLDINAGRNILMENRASITSLGAIVAGIRSPVQAWYCRRARARGAGLHKVHRALPESAERCQCGRSAQRAAGQSGQDLCR